VLERQGVVQDVEVALWKARLGRTGAAAERRGVGMGAAEQGATDTERGHAGARADDLAQEIAAAGRLVERAKNCFPDFFLCLVQWAHSTLQLLS